jgi:hypothetical protein
MSESFSEPAEDSATESDVERNDDQVEPGSESEYVGRVQGADEGYEGEQGAEVRAKGDGDSASGASASDS